MDYTGFERPVFRNQLRGSKTVVAGLVAAYWPNPGENLLALDRIFEKMSTALGELRPTYGPHGDMRGQWDPKDEENHHEYSCDCPYEYCSICCPDASEESDSDMEELRMVF
ncbi:unnamed protein product [Calypogeia fissa]